ncbi:MAG: ATP-binding protein [Thermoguttaceae bacterium]|jgi:signal transduction histidine kinase
MSYRLLKRVFGETKLELKLLLLFGVGLLTVIVTSFWWYGRKTAELVYEQNRNTGRLVVEQIMLGRHLAAYTATPEEQPKRLALIPPSPEEVAHERQLNEELVDWVRKSFSKQHEAMDLIWTYRTPGGRIPLDDEEKKVRDEFLQARREAQPGAGPAAEWKELRGAEEYRYFEAIRAQESCFRCHAVPPGGSGIDLGGSGVPLVGGPSVSLGELMAIARVTLPNGPTQRRLDKNWSILWATAILAVFLAMLTSYAIVRYVIVKPLGHLRDVSDAISRGNTALRAEIHTGDEFEGLAVAFNRMLRHLVAVQDELRQANVNLDTKVDELARANMRLYELNTLKSEFLATMSHELRTPLNSILGFSEVLGAIDALDEKQKRYVQNIEQSGRTLLDMINDILDLAKMESGKMEVRLTDFQVAQVVAAQCDMARPLAEKKNIDLAATIPPDLPPVRQDQARVQQILNNLLSNAIKFTPEGGRVDIRVRRSDADELVLDVSDTGVGIPEEEQQIIFEKFRQGRVGLDAGDAMTREYSGSGLGLSIVKELCKLLGGEISLASQLGKGSTFTVRLPWTLAEPARPGSPLIEDLDEFSKTRFEYGRP